MKLAVVHCRVTPGGAWEVCKDLIQEDMEKESFSAIKIFTMYSEISTVTVGGKQIPIVTALPIRLNNFFLRNARKKLPLLGQLFDYRNLMFFYPSLMKILSRKISQHMPDRTLISSFAIAKNIEQCKKNLTITSPSVLYLHSPMQYIRSHTKEYQHKLKGWKGLVFRKIIPRLRTWDLLYTHYDQVYVNSVFTQQVTKEIYGIESQVKYPKLQQKFFDEQVILDPQNYVVCVGRVVKFVREVDLIIKAFNAIGYPLVIVGSGPDEQELRKLAKDTISFTGRNPSNMVDVIKHSKGLINLTKESFGLSTAEALCLGVPVLGYDQGATSELVDGASGMLIERKTIEEIKRIFPIFIEKNRDRKYIASRARKLFVAK